MVGDLLRIGCGGGFWGDTEEGPAQLVRSGLIDVLIIDYLAEITMSLLARLRQRDPSAGYVPDFVSQITALAPEIATRRIRVVVNAGGVNPLGCRDAVEAALAKAGVSLRVAAIVGDDLAHLADRLREAGTRDMETGAPFPDRPLSLNAYLGAFPIAAALERGADIVITGRCADSALALGPLIHRFGWTTADLDRLAQGSIAGHVIECGSQATGGIATDWQDVPGWDDMGMPIAECARDGSFVVTKPPGTGGRVSPETVAEQILYEVGDPTAYLLPDLVCDLSQVTAVADGPDRVRVTGARGLPPTQTYKASITYPDGFKAVGLMMIGGREAADKARRTAEAILTRVRRLLATRGLADFRRVSVEVLGAEATYGPHARTGTTREVVLKVAVLHEAKAGCELFSREFLPSATAMAQGITGFSGGRPKVTPVVRLFSCLVDKAEVTPTVVFDGEEIVLGLKAGAPSPPAGLLRKQPGGPRVSEGRMRGHPRCLAGDPSSDPAPQGHLLPQGEKEARGGDVRTVSLAALAYGRSGDKGDTANIAIMARRPDYIPILARALTPERVGTYLAHVVKGPVERFPVPGLGGFNFLLHEALDGGGIASLRHDPQGKALAQMLLDIEVPVPAAWCEPGGPLAGVGW